MRIAVPKQGSTEDHVIVEGQEEDIKQLITSIENLLKSEVRRVAAESSFPLSSSSSSSTSPIPSSKAADAPAKSAFPAGPINKVIFFPDKDTVKNPSIQIKN